MAKRNRNIKCISYSKIFTQLRHEFGFEGFTDNLIWDVVTKDEGLRMKTLIGKKRYIEIALKL